MQEEPRLREDVQAVLDAISVLRERHFKLEETTGHLPNLHGANLMGANLTAAVLSGANLQSTNLSRARLNWANLSNAEMSGADLSNAQLRGANLSGAALSGANLTSADLASADLSGAELPRCATGWCVHVQYKLGSGINLSRTNLIGTNLSSAQLSLGPGQDPATGLTQSWLNEACADPRRPPKLDGVVDGGTGKPLVWRGKPLDGQA